MSSTDLRSLLNLSPSSAAISNQIIRLSRLVKNTPDATVPAVKSYPDAVYFNYLELGLSLHFAPKNGYKPATGAERAGLREENLALDSIDIYNVPRTARNTSEGAFAAYPVTPFVLALSSSATLQVIRETTGKEFVGNLGEPERKGGGSGPSSGSIGIWCEWTKEGVMVEFGGDDARGPNAWEQGKDAVWRVVTIFRPT